MDPRSRSYSRSASRPRWRGLLPIEHGSWSLAGEPIALGLIAAPSLAGAALAVAAFAAFLARRPLVLSRKAGSTQELARGAFVGCALLAVFALGVAAFVGPWKSLLALLAGVPAALLFLFFDAQREARAEAAEISGVLAFAVVPVAMAAFAGWSWPLAAALGFTAISRSVPVVLTVRAYLRSNRGDYSGRLRAIVASTLILCTAAALAWWWRMPWTVAALAALQLVRTAWLLAPRAARFQARKLGIVEAVSGGVFVVLAGLAWRLAL